MIKKSGLARREESLSPVLISSQWPKRGVHIRLILMPSDPHVDIFKHLLVEADV